GHFLERQRVFNGDSYLSRRLAEEINIFGGKRTLQLTCNYQDSDGSTMAHQWYQTVALQALCNHESVYFRPEFVMIVCVYDYRYRAIPGSFEGEPRRDHNLFLNESFGIRKIDSINPTLRRYLIEKCNPCGIGMHDLSSGN